MLLRKVTRKNLPFFIISHNPQPTNSSSHQNGDKYVSSGSDTEMCDKQFGKSSSLFSCATEEEFRFLVSQKLFAPPQSYSTPVCNLQLIINYSHQILVFTKYLVVLRCGSGENRVVSYYEYHDRDVSCFDVYQPATGAGRKPWSMVHYWSFIIGHSSLDL